MLHDARPVRTDHVERYPLPRVIVVAAGLDHHRQAVLPERAEGRLEGRDLGFGDRGSEDAREAPRKPRHPALDPAALVLGDDPRHGLDEARPIGSDERQHDRLHGVSFRRTAPEACRSWRRSARIPRRSAGASRAR